MRWNEEEEEEKEEEEASGSVVAQINVTRSSCTEHVFRLFGSKKVFLNAKDAN